jgi:O-antigen/teichoic acid export membrane protein
VAGTPFSDRNVINVKATLFKVNATKQNIAANFVGRLLTGVLRFALTPLFVNILGIESFALLGIYTSLAGLLVILDMGLSSTLNREMARACATNTNSQETCDLVRTFELLYWTVGIGSGILIFLLAPTLASHWFIVDKLPRGTVEKALRIMGLIIASQWPVSLYSGALTGLQRQVLLNSINVGGAVLQGIGALAVLHWISRSISVYFYWQLFACIAQTAAFWMCVWSALPHAARPPRFSLNLWLKHWRFAGGMAGISITSVILMQSDKLMVSKMLPLAVFGSYTLAFTLGGILAYIAAPIFVAVSPRLASLVASDSPGEVSRSYHKGSQLVAIAVFPTAITFAFFAKELLPYWINDATVVRNVCHFLLPVLVGSAFNSIMLLPFALQIAYGWTKLSLYKNIIAVTLFTPITFVAIVRYGAVGGAVVWAAINISYFVLEVPIMHSRLLRHSLAIWYLRDIGIPILVSGVVAALGHTLFVEIGKFGAILTLATWIVELVMSVLALHASKRWARLDQGLITDFLYQDRTFRESIAD